ncbi:hypothetical protein [Streptomonospora arabica]|uniref:Uncharacterized protein n=1 Tax=Streptomonospora arabica TaxID=412417 RepID=A0ABV9SKI3_9ACTN
MSAPYRYRGGGHGEIESPGTVAADYADEWDIRCFLWCGGEWWTAERHRQVPQAPEDPPDAGADRLCTRFAGWSSHARIRLWVEAQAEALKTSDDTLNTT